MRLFSTLFFIGFTVSIFAQQKDSAAIKYAATITEADLSKHLHILASDEFGGRETGEKSIDLASDYLTNFYENADLEKVKDNSYLQAYNLILQPAEGISIHTSKKTFAFKKDFYIFPSYFKNEEINTRAIFLGYGIDDEKYSDYNGVDVAGKVVIVYDGEPKKEDGNYLISGTEKQSDWSNWLRFLKVKKAKEKGAKAICIIDKSIEQNTKLYTEYIDSKKTDIVSKSTKFSFPAFYVSEELAKALIGKKKLPKKELPAIKKIVSKKKIQIKINRENKEKIANNVMAYVEGSDKKEEVIVVSAHYDHIGVEGGEVFNGADDDGSGTVAVMEMAEAFMLAKKEGHGPRRSLLFLNVSGEEKGLLGSRYYTDNPVIPLENTVANLNIDMIGRLDKKHEDNENYIYIIGADILSQDLHDINEHTNSTYSKLDLDYTYNDVNDPNRYYYRSDHYNFAKNNVPAIFYFNGVHADYHKSTDTVDKIIFSKMEKITRLVFHTAWEIANREERVRLNGRDIAK